MHPIIYLIGYRGSGKTTVGRVLAARLGWDFVDADALLEERGGKSIREIFATEGELAFRNLESDILDELAKRTRVVVATGGGVVLREQNRALLRESGFVAWLSAEPATLWERIQADSTTAARRPDLSVGGLAEIEQLLTTRLPLYRMCANIETPVAAMSPEQVADAILAAWESPKSSG